MRLLAPALVLLLFGGGTAAADENANARCEISEGSDVWRGPCFIEREGPHNVTLGWVPDHRFPFGWSGIFFTSTDGRSWRLRVHISFGDDVDLGVMRRDPAEPDCWIGAGLKICARAAG